MASNQPQLLSSGVSGLDSVLHGGFPADHAYLVSGVSGTGKTSLSFQFLAQGIENGESAVYVSFSETLPELHEVGRSHGWPVDEIEVCELATELSERSTSGSSIFHGAEVELPEAVSQILDIVERVEPRRLAVDSLTELRNMAESHRSYRRALFHLKVSLEQAGVTTIFVGEKGHEARTEAKSIVHGVLELQMETPLYGPIHRRLQVSKLRGKTYESGYHDFAIVTGGLEVFPRIRPREIHREIGNGEPVESGVDSLDELMGGGIDRGTTSLLIGPSGTGKSSIIMQYAVAAAQRGEKAVVYTFTEDTETIRTRSEGMGLPLSKFMESDHIRIQAIDSAELSPGHFAHLIRQEVTDRDVAFVALDSINGYIHAMPSDRALVPHLHDLLTYLGSQGIIMMMVMTLSGLLGANESRVANLSYLADSIVYLRYVEKEECVYRTITTVKQRTRSHAKDVRRLRLGSGGVRVGKPLSPSSDPSGEDDGSFFSGGSDGD